jgi:hypothetical protein
MKQASSTRRAAYGVLLVALTVVLTLPVQAQILRRPVLEYCTGTWCQYCPCGHSIIENTILPNIPDAIIIGYHGPANTSSEPFSFFPGNSIITALGFSAYPTGIVDRVSGIIDRGSWYAFMNSRWNIWSSVRISITKLYDDGTRTLSATVSVTPGTQLTGMYKINLILLEDSLFYPQTGNSGCPGASVYRHDHVVREMINGYLGQDLNTGSPWPSGQTISTVLNYTVPSTFLPRQCKLVAVVYKVGSPLSSAAEIQQAEQWDVPGTISSVEGTLTVPTSFAVSQNYPNPFNPSTNIDYAVSKPSFVSVKVYNLLGQEVRRLVSEEKGVGVYQATWDGKDNVGTEVPSGMYLYKMVAGSFSETKKMMFMK